MAVKSLKSLPENEILEFINSFDTVLSDCDGVLWKHMTPYPNAANVLNLFRDIGKQVYYVTNNSTKTRKECVQKCEALEFKATENEIFCTSNMIVQYLKDMQFQKKVYVIGSEGITKELDMAGIPHSDIGPDVQNSNVPYNEVELEEDIGAVVVGFDEHFSFPKLIKATNYLANDEVLFLATNTDEQFPSNKLVVPGTGSFVRCVETASGRKPFIIGKPSTYTATMLKTHFDVKPEKTLIIGDRANTDILLGKRCGFKTLLVLSGVTTLKELNEWQKSNTPEDKELLPDYYTDSIGDLLPYLQKLYNK